MEKRAGEIKNIQKKFIESNLDITREVCDMDVYDS